MIYDIIGDVHGQFDKLVGLLDTMGYTHNGSHYVPPVGHHAVFIGDLIDRGTGQLATLETAFAMLDNGAASIVMGNHEYNALAYATPDARDARAYLRRHNDVHTRQHAAFIAEVGFGSALHQFWLKRLYELPLWLELGGACFVHACWDTAAMAVLKPLLTADHRLTPHGLQLTSQKNTPEYDALERVLKGVETRLPNDLFMLDKEGHKRHNVRVKWWQPPLSGQPIHQIARAGKSDLLHIPADTLADLIEFELTTDKPVFVGHYWLTGTPAPLSEQVVCVDYSAGGGGYLTAYQFDSNHPKLTADHFVQFICD